MSNKNMRLGKHLTILMGMLIAFVFLVESVGAAVVLPSVYTLPFKASNILVTRTGDKYKNDYIAAGLTRYTSVDYHSGTNRAAIDFSLSSGTAVVAAAPGQVVAKDSECLFIKTGNQYAFYLHIVPSVANGTWVSRGQQIGTVAGSSPNDCFGATGWTGVHLHFAVCTTLYCPSGTEIPVFFQNVPQTTNQINTSQKCPAGLICPKKTNVYTFKYSGISNRQQFTSGSSTFWRDSSNNLNLKVCASNLTNKYVFVEMSRPGKIWSYYKLATSTCVTFSDLDGPGPVNSNTTYTTRASLRDWPDATWPVPCYSSSGNYGLCDKITTP